MDRQRSTPCVETLEGRQLLSADNLGQHVLQTAQEGPSGQSTLVHATQAASGTEFGQVVASTAQNPETYPD